MTRPINIHEDLKKAFGSHFRQKVSTSRKTGKARRKHFRVDIEADDLFVDPRAKEINGAFGDLIAETARKQIRGIKRNVSEETLARRKRYARDKQSRSYKKKYSGGRIGEMPPLRGADQTQWGNDSGRLGDSIVARLRRRSTGVSTGTINVASNRLDPKSFGRASDFAAFVRTLRQEAPFLAGKLAGKEAEEWKRGLKTIAEATVALSQEDLRRKKRRLRDIKLRILSQIGRATFGGVL